MLKKLGTSLLTFFIIILGSSIILTLLNYFNLISPKVLSILKLLTTLIAIFISSYKLGKQSEKKGYIEGIKFGTIIISIFLLLILLFDKFSIKSLIYYLIILLTSILSSMLGINHKKK